MAKHKFKMERRFDAAPGVTVTIDRASETFTVRPFRRKREYTLPLFVVAEMVWWRIVKAEAAEKLAAKRKAKAERKKLRGGR